MRGGFSALIGSILRIRGVTLVDLFSRPNPSHSFRARLDFVCSSAMFSLSKFLTIFSTADMCSISEPLVITNISSIHASVCGDSSNIEKLLFETPPA